MRRRFRRRRGMLPYLGASGPEDRVVAPRRAETELLELVKSASTGRRGHLAPEQLGERLDLAKLYRLSRALWRRGQIAMLPKALDIPNPRWERIAHFLDTCRDPDQKAAEDTAAFLESKRLMTGVGEFLGFSVVRTSSQPIDHFYIRYDDPPLDCFTGEVAVFVSRGEVPALEVEGWTNALKRLDATVQNRLAFGLVDRMRPLDPDLLDQMREAAQSSARRFVIWSTKDLCRAILAQDPPAYANRSAIEQLDLLEIQPYRTHGSTSSIMFFGRGREIDWMLNEPRTSYAIYGGRQLGKTSLLRRLEEALSQRDNQRTAFITCEGIQDNLVLGTEILKAFGVSVAGVRTVADFERVFRDHLRTQRHRHTIFIDEVDDVIDTDLGSGQKIFVSLRNIHNDYRGKCRFFFAGFKKLYSEFFRLYAPFQNFAEPFELKELPPRDALKLIEEPLCRRLGLAFDQRTTALERIYAYTSGHPAFIQQFCKCLIARLANEFRREITQTDIEFVYGSDEYRALVLRNHADNFREGETSGEVLPKLIVCHIVFEELNAFSEGQLRQSLEHAGIRVEPSRLRHELQKLSMTSVLVRHRGGYAFTNSVYPRLLRESEDLAELLLGLTEQYRHLAPSNAAGTAEIEPVFNIRRTDIHRVFRDFERSYVLIGGRGMGKTAMLRALFDLYQEDRSSLAAWIAGPAPSGGSPFLSRCLEALGLEPGNARQCLDTLSQAVREEHAKGIRIVLLIDDLEAIFHDGHDRAIHTFFALLRLHEASGAGFRLLATGGPRLRAAAQDPKLASRVERLDLRPLDERDARALAEFFLRSERNLTVEDDTLVELMLEFTGGNGALIRTLIRQLSPRTRRVEETDVLRVVEAEDFQQSVLDVYEADWGDGEHRLVAALISLSADRFTAEAVAEQLGSTEEEVLPTLRDLWLVGFLRRVGRTFRFANPHYRDAYVWRNSRPS